jgi:hypothetical protein
MSGEGSTQCKIKLLFAEFGNDNSKTTEFWIPNAVGFY